ncbi:hypothetical protein AKJ64_04995, partial [candidate division MSBL1 archaeon SCGC-AAA259E17]
KIPICHISIYFTPPLAHPKRTRIITDEKIKTDAKASEALAQLTRTGWLPEAWVPPKEVRMLQEKLRRRAYLVWKRTGFKNKIKADLAKQGIRRDFSYSEDDKKWLRGLEIDSINDYLFIIEALNDPIDRLKREIKREARKDEDKACDDYPWNRVYLGFDHYYRNW